MKTSQINPQAPETPGTPPPGDGEKAPCSSACAKSSQVTLEEVVARAFHEAYERLAPQHGYRTREASAKPWNEVPENNRALMIATAAEVVERLNLTPWKLESDLCCGFWSAPQPCPFAGEVEGLEVLCTCCDECRRQCAHDV